MQPASDTAIPAVPETQTFPKPAAMAVAVPPVRTRRISVGLQNHPPTGELLTMQRPRHPVISAIKDGQFYILYFQV